MEKILQPILIALSSAGILGLYQIALKPNMILNWFYNYLIYKLKPTKILGSLIYKKNYRDYIFKFMTCSYCHGFWFTGIYSYLLTHSLKEVAIIIGLWFLIQDYIIKKLH